MRNAAWWIGLLIGAGALASPASAGRGDDGFGFGPHAGRGRLGVQVQELNPELREFLGAPTERGVLVSRVEEDSPAADAGLRVGDVIVRVGEREVENAHDLTREVAGVAEGEAVEIEISRKGDAKTFSAKPRGAPNQGFELPTMKRWREQPHAMPHFSFGDELQRRLEAIEKRLQEIERRLPDADLHPRKT